MRLPDDLVVLDAPRPRATRRRNGHARWLLYSLLWAGCSDRWQRDRPGVRPGGMDPVALVFRTCNSVTARLPWTLVGLDQDKGGRNPCRRFDGRRNRNPAR